jgi:ubiquitin carboxyl-terminal hydrolase 25/28
MSSAGKTAPKLLHDFLEFDPLKVHGANILTDLSPPVGEGPQIAPGHGSCKHEYATKWKQSVSPGQDERAQQGSQYKAAVICKKCRLHADVHISYDHASPEGACPKDGYPLHHFLWRKEEDETTSNRIVYAWSCSSPDCQAVLRTTFKLPRFARKDIQHLTDPALLQGRYDATYQADPTRTGLRLASPVDALQRLRRYLNDSLNPEHTKRSFPANNKRFMEAFGVEGRDCAELLQNLGFRYKPGGVEDGVVQDAAWTLPNPGNVPNRLQTDGESPREVLEDVEAELIAWMYELAAKHNIINPASGEGWPSADRDIERLLAAQGCKFDPHLLSVM